MTPGNRDRSSVGNQSGKRGERSRSFEQARHPLREKGRDLFLARDFPEDLRGLVSDPKRILVLGSGDGKEARALRGHFPSAQVVSLDLSEAEVSWLVSSGLGDPNLVRGDWDQAPFPSEVFDLAVFFAALHHSTDLATTLSEAARVLAPGGWVYATHEPMASLLSGKWQRRRMAEIAAEEGGIETSPSRTDYVRACAYAGLSEIAIRPSPLNRIRLLELRDGFGDVRLRRSDLPERLVRFLLRCATPLGETFESNLIFSAQKLALGLYGVTLVARKELAESEPLP